MNEKTAIIRDVRFGCRDTSKPVLSFAVELENGMCALQILSAKDACDLIRNNQIVEVHDLEGKMCIVEEDGCTIMFVRMWGN